jgi:Subtilase family
MFVGRKRTLLLCAQVVISSLPIATAPGFVVPTPWSVDSGQIDYSFFHGTSAAAPHVSGIVALMLQKNPSLTAPQVEAILESTAMPLAPGCRNVTAAGVGPGPAPTWSVFGNVFFFPGTVCWGADVAGHGIARAGAALAATP